MVNGIIWVLKLLATLIFLVIEVAVGAAGKYIILYSATFVTEILMGSFYMNFLDRNRNRILCLLYIRIEET